MTKKELIEILKIMHKDAKAVPWGRYVPYYEFYQDENGQKPRLTPEEKSKWDNLTYFRRSS